MERLVYLIDLLKEYFIQNKAWVGLFVIGVSITSIVAAIKDWNWIFGDVNPVTYDLGKLDGIINVFGRKTARVMAGIGGIVGILAGVGWIILSIIKLFF